MFRHYPRRAHLFAALVLSSISVGATTPSKDPLDQFTRVLDKDVIFYRWQSTASGENLARAGVMTEDLNRYFMGMKENIVAGSGVYFAGNEVSSAIYLPSAGGNLLEVHLPKGTRVVDAHEPAQIEALTKAGYDLDKLGAGVGAENGLVIKYADDWYVGKNLTGRAKFKLYPSEDQTAEDFHRGLVRASSSEEVARARAQMHAQIARAAPALRRRLFANDPLHAANLAAMPVPEMAATLENRLGDQLSGHEARNILDHLGGHEDVRAELARTHPRLYENMADQVIERTRGAALGDAHFGALRTLATSGGLDPERRRERILKVILDNLSSGGMIDGLEETERRVAPLLREVTLTAAERERVAQQLAVVFKFADPAVDQTTPLRSLLKAARLTDHGSLQADVDRLDRRRERFARAIAPRTMDDVVGGLREHENFAEFSAIYRKLSSRIPPVSMNEAYTMFVKNHPAEYTALFKSGDDLMLGALYKPTTDGESFALMYKQAVAAGADARLKFAQSCLGHPPCAHNLVHLVAADRGRLFAGLDAMPSLAPTLRRLHENDADLANRFLNVMVGAPAPAPARRAFLSEVRSGNNKMEATGVSVARRKVRLKIPRAECVTALIDE